MEFDKVIRERKSTRRFSDKKVEKDTLLKILEAGRLAPTAKNIQPIKIYVVESEEGLKSIDKASPCRYNAPVVLVVCGDKNKAFTKGEHSTYEVDASIVATHMLLEATNVGVDNIWVDMFDRDILRKEFSIPEDLIPVCILPMGYKSKICPPSPLHKIRKSLDKIVEYK
ncbi:MAG: nitroreductase family protein [Bacilli bacterium]|nr:nitroreductase family protein [Bacilli bacterium]